MIIGKYVKQSVLSYSEHSYRSMNKLGAKRYLYAPVLLFAPKRQALLPLCRFCLYHLNLLSKLFTVNYFLSAKCYQKASEK